MSSSPPTPALDPLAEILALGGRALGRRLGAVEERLVEVCRFGRELAFAAESTISAGGKRLRPLLVFLCAPDGLGGEGGDHEPALVRAAVAVELIHSATLVHDDVLDGASLRRGRPTVVASAGREVATATGDLLFSRGFAELAASFSPTQLRCLSRASSALAQGELLQREDAWNADVGIERYLHRCELKTARLFESACELGTLAGGAPAPWASALSAFGRRIGLAFQLLDDVLDVSGPPQRTGKHRGTDLLDGTTTLPLIIARQRDNGLAALTLRGLSGAEEAEEVCRRIERTGALEAAREQALGIVAAAREQLPDDLAPRQRQSLELMAQGVVARYS
jgi:geranylgeranyl pyrophosphate synthase